MSIEASSHVWKNSKQSGSKLLLLLTIADYTNAEGWAWPSVASLCKRTRLGERYVQKMLRELAEAGEILIKERKNTSNFYRVLGIDWDNQGVNHSSPGGEPQFTGGVNPSSPNPLIDPLMKEEKKTAPAPQDEEREKSTRKTAEEITEAWNQLPTVLPRVASFGKERLGNLRERMKDAFWRENWKAALEHIPNCPFLIGEEKGRDGRTFRASIEFFLRHDSVSKILEGKYNPAPEDPSDWYKKHY